MANPLPFTLPPQDPRKELDRRIAAAPHDHAEALLVAWDTLQMAHDRGMLELLRGLMSGRDKIATELGAALASPEAIAALRNLISLGRILGSLDPQTLDHLAKAVQGPAVQNDVIGRPPSLWHIGRTLFSADGRRGLAFTAGFIVGLGRALKKSPPKP